MKRFLLAAVAALPLAGCLAEAPAPNAQAWNGHWKDVHQTDANEFEYADYGVGLTANAGDIAQSYCRARGYDYGRVGHEGLFRGDPTRFTCHSNGEMRYAPPAAAPHQPLVTDCISDEIGTSCITG
jgi:hypothetical protein